MTYSDLRPHDCRPQCRHQFESPSASPCRGCPWEHGDKEECSVDCKKLKPFQSIPVNLSIDRSNDSELIDDPVIPQKRLPKRIAKIPEGQLCTIDGCGRKAMYACFKDLYLGFICHACYHRFMREWRRCGRITISRN